MIKNSNVIGLKSQIAFTIIRAIIRVIIRTRKRNQVRRKRDKFLDAHGSAPVPRVPAYSRVRGTRVRAYEYPF